MRPTLRPLALLAALAGLSGCSGGGPLSGLTGSVAGFVYLNGSQLVVRAHATPDAGETPAGGAGCFIAGGIGTADNLGFFQIDGVPTGAQTLTVTLSGALPLDVPVTIVAGQTTLAGLGGGPPVARQWTVLLYLAADNAREAEALATLNALETIGSSDAVTVLALLDRAGGFDTSNGNWTGTRRFVVGQDADPQTVTSSRTSTEGGTAVDLGEQDLADPAILRAFLRFGVQSFPASHYLAVVWGTGGGWRTGVSGRSVVGDDAGGTSLAVTGLDTALDANQDLDIVVFDAPFLQSLEAAYEARRRCDVIVGTEAGSAALSFPYARWLQRLAANPFVAGPNLARAMVDDTLDAATGSRETCASAVATDGLADLADALDAYAGRLRDLGAAAQNSATAVRGEAQRFGGADPVFGGYFDLGDLVSRTATAVSDGTLTLRAIAVQSALSNAVLRNGRTGSSMAAATGLGLYCPDRADYLGPGVGGRPATRADYAELALSGATHWDEWLDEFTARMPAP
ncbi:MAG: hypothetical protein HYU66_11080 [Armatimonadetes bacterium]|nr:hypothetical protein [Armatimonadota bacterium]